MRVCLCCVFYFLVSGCGIESTIPTTTTDDSSSDRAVFISTIEVTEEGSQVTCVLNEALVSENMEIPLFLEYEGTQIERVVLENQNEFTFTAYRPPADGMIVCVVELANAEFESEEGWLTK